jgi:hypothetical protein
MNARREFDWRRRNALDHFREGRSRVVYADKRARRFDAGVAREDDHGGLGGLDRTKVLRAGDKRQIAGARLADARHTGHDCVGITRQFSAHQLGNLARGQLHD